MNIKTLLTIICALNAAHLAGAGIFSPRPLRAVTAVSRTALQPRMMTPLMAASPKALPVRSFAAKRKTPTAIIPTTAASFCSDWKVDAQIYLKQSSASGSPAETVQQLKKFAERQAAQELALVYKADSCLYRHTLRFACWNNKIDYYDGVLSTLPKPKK